MWQDQGWILLASGKIYKYTGVYRQPAESPEADDKEMGTGRHCGMCLESVRGYGLNKRHYISLLSVFCKCYNI